MKNHFSNVVFIVLDTHRADRLGCYGYSRGTSPNIDAFAQKATLFENAIAPAQWTIPTHASMFSGEYPATHHTIQAGDALSEDFPTLAQYFHKTGYRTIGFCNNPLVGLLDNGFRRGFQEFYNYGGTVPSKPSTNGHQPPTLFAKIHAQYLKVIDRIATPIQQAVATSPEVFQLVLNPLLVPLWTRYANFKGDTLASIRDTARHVQHWDSQPQFVFLNLMGTHLPYAPPKKFIQSFAPAVLDEPEAQDFIQTYNTQALHWLLPLEKPYPALEAQTLNDMYDAEVAYQDHLLHQLLATLEQPEHRDNTVVIIVGDHGEMLGEHQIMGHGIGVHQELVHVPLMIRFPGQETDHRVKKAVSTMHIFHTLLDVAGINSDKINHGTLSGHSLKNPDALPEIIFSEAYTPITLLKIIQKYSPNLMNSFHCASPRWAVYNNPYKLIRTENAYDNLFNYLEDPQEKDHLSSKTDCMKKMGTELEAFLAAAKFRGSESLQGSAANLEDEDVLNRLRGLGYIE